MLRQHLRDLRKKRDFYCNKNLANGGEGGIRTHVALITPKRFRVISNQLQLSYFDAIWQKLKEAQSPVFMRISEVGLLEIRLQ